MLLVLALLGCGSGGEDKRAPEPRSAPVRPAGPPELTPYPSATRFCNGTVSLEGTGGGHLSWTAYASDDRFASVVAHYKKALGTENLEERGADATWRFPTEEEPRRVLSVELAASAGPWKRECGAPRDANTVITISRLQRQSSSD